jgi:methyl-galactoside transport system substrate-binding protein
MKKLFVLGLTLFAAVSLSACGSNDDTIVIGANIYNYADNFMGSVVKTTLVDYAEEKGVTLDLVDSAGDQATLNNQVDVFIDKGVDVLVINLVNPDSAQIIVDKAKAADIPLILFNKEADKDVMATYDKVWYVGTISAESGIIQGEMMVTDWQANPAWDKNNDGVVDYVLLKGEIGHPDAEARTLESVKAFTDAGIQVNELALLADNAWSTAFGTSTMETWITSFGDSIELVIANNDGMALGAIAAMQTAGVSIPIYGVDALPDALTAIENGTLNGTVLNDGANQAKATIDLAINAAKGETDVTTGTDWVLSTDGTKAVRVAYVAVTKDNYEDFR